MKELLEKILRGGTRYTMLDGGFMEIQSYYSGETVIINLNEINDEAVLSYEEYVEQVENHEELFY